MDKSLFHSSHVSSGGVSLIVLPQQWHRVFVAWTAVVVMGNPQPRIKAADKLSITIFKLE
jgi:hypothetical protein